MKESTRYVHGGRWAVAMLAAAAGLTAAPAVARADIKAQQRISGKGAYGIVHYGATGGRRYIQIYVHDTSPDNKCAEIWADFQTQNIGAKHRHIDPVRAIICGYNRQGWSERYYVAANDGNGVVTGLHWVDACWRSRNARDCVRETADNSSFIAHGNYKNLRIINTD